MDNSTCISRNNLFYRNDFNAFQFDFDTNTHVWALDNIRSSAGNADKDAEIINAHTDGQLGQYNPFFDYDPSDVFNSNLMAVTEDGYDTGVELPGNDMDMFGNVRGSYNGVWTRGAIQQTTERPTDMTNPPNTQATQAALDSIKADCDTLNALGVGTSTITASNLTSQDYEAAIATQRTNMQNIIDDNSLSYTLTSLPGTLAGAFSTMYTDLVGIEAALS